jgi:hypothetical protein
VSPTPPPPPRATPLPPFAAAPLPPPQWAPPAAAWAPPLQQPQPAALSFAPTLWSSGSGGGGGPVRGPVAASPVGPPSLGAPGQRVSLGNGAFASATWGASGLPGASPALWDATAQPQPAQHWGWGGGADAGGGALGGALSRLAPGATQPEHDASWAAPQPRSLPAMGLWHAA